MPRPEQSRTAGGFVAHQRGAMFNDLAPFVKAPDHNPETAKSCPECNGSPTFFAEYVDENGGEVHVDGCCSRCKGLGVIDESGGQFSNGRPSETIRPNSYDFLKCPGCGKHFSHKDPNVWTGLRHTCGQRIILLLDPKSAEPPNPPKLPS